MSIFKKKKKNVLFLTFSFGKKIKEYIKQFNKLFNDNLSKALKRASKNKTSLILFLIIIIIYLVFIWQNFLLYLSDISRSFGYLDYQNNWRALDDFIKLKVPFKDYYYEYGWFFLLLQSISFIAFGNNFLSLLISREIFLPLAGLFVSLFVAKNILSKNKLILIFLLLSFLFNTNNNYVSLRHLISELSLSILILSISKNKISGTKIIIAGLIAGLGFLTSSEYGLVLNISILGFFILGYFKAGIKPSMIRNFYLAEFLIIIPYYLWLAVNSVLINYFEFTKGFMNVFYYNSPCDGSFPRFSEIELLRSSSKLIIFNLPIEFLQKLNFYIVPIFYISILFMLVILFFRKRINSKKYLTIGVLTIYGIGAYFRTVITPCTSYAAYGLVPFFLLICLGIGIITDKLSKKSNFYKIKVYFLILLTCLWFVITENTGIFIKLVGVKYSPPEIIREKTEYYPTANYPINNQLVKNYQEITDYLVKNTKKDDYLFVYPCGIYNFTTGRRAATSTTNKAQFLAGEQFIYQTINEIKTKNPKFIILNLYYNGVVLYDKTQADNFPGGIVFAEEDNIMETYILENYQIKYKNEIAIIMQKRNIPLKIPKKKILYLWQKNDQANVKIFNLKTLHKGDYVIVGKNASWEINFKNPLESSDIHFSVKVTGNLPKVLTRYKLNIYFNQDKKFAPPDYQTMATKDWQIIKIPLGNKKTIDKIKITIGSNTGLLWFVNPRELNIEKIEFY